MLETDSKTKLPDHYSGKHKGSFAYLTIKDRLPVILVKVIDNLCQDKHVFGDEHGEVGKKEIKEVIGRLSALQSEMITNKPIKRLLDDGPDVTLWNNYLDQQNTNFDFSAAWYNSSWLYVECYLYRRMKEAFELSSVLKDYDPFHKQKLEFLLKSMNDMEKLANTLFQTVFSLESSKDPFNLYNLFIFYLEVSLWGNKCDLSISAGKTNISHSVQVQALKNKILVNDAENAWNSLKEANGRRSGEVHIHFVLDNAGFELFCDFCFLHFLLAAKLVKRISLHVKQIPWFVSDTLEKDIQCLLETLMNSNQDVLVNLSKQWLCNMTNGLWTVENELFWTLPHDFSEMSSVASNLYDKLSQSDLIIFKGDLNYRKLTGDRQWSETTLFKTALNNFLPTSLLSLRTIKADVVVGLSSGLSEKLDKLSLNWKCTGEYALIQYIQKEN